MRPRPKVERPTPPPPRRDGEDDPRAGALLACLAARSTWLMNGLARGARVERGLPGRMRKSLSSPLMRASQEARRSRPYNSPLILQAKSPMRMHDRPPYAQNTEPFQWLDGGLRWRFYLAVFQSPCLSRPATLPSLSGSSLQREGARFRSWRTSRGRAGDEQRPGREWRERIERRRRRIRSCAHAAFAVQTGCRYHVGRSRDEERCIAPIGDARRADDSARRERIAAEKGNERGDVVARFGRQVAFACEVFVIPAGAEIIGGEHVGDIAVAVPHGAQIG